MKYEEVTPSVYKIVPTQEADRHVSVIVTVDTAGSVDESLVKDSIDISNYEEEIGVEIPTESLPVLIDRLQRIWDKYTRQNG